MVAMAKCLACRKSFEEEEIAVGKIKEMNEDIQWITKNYEKLKEKYAEKFIVVRKGKVILFETDYNTLRRKLNDLRRENPELKLAVIEKIRTKPLKLLL